MNAILIISILSGIGALILINIVKKRAIKRAREESFEIKIPIKRKYSDMEISLIYLLQTRRLYKGLKDLKLNDTVSTVCQEHSLNMAKTLKASHQNAGIRKQKLKKAIGITQAGEIVAKGQRNAESILSSFLKKKTKVTDKSGKVTYEPLVTYEYLHKEIIEDPKWTQFGLSIEKGILRIYTTCIFVK